MYQLFDDENNTRVIVSGSSRVVSTDGAFALACGAPDASSGIGECSGRLASSLFTSGGTHSLVLEADTEAVKQGLQPSAFDTVLLLADPRWYHDGGWDGLYLPEATFGAVVPFDDVFVAEGASSATFTVDVMLKSRMEGVTSSQRTVSTGQFALYWSGPHNCAVVRTSEMNGAWSTFVEPPSQQPGHKAKQPLPKGPR